jgi:SAM-dependent methyltransferase
MLSKVQYKLLKRISPGAPTSCDGSAYHGKSKLAILLGKEFLSEVEDKTVIDFGCGEGSEAVEIAVHGAKRVIGIDIQRKLLETARKRATDAGVAETCWFGSSTEEKADIVVSIDSFEHFADPARVLKVMHSLLRPGGEIVASFGPTWYHPLGGHLFSVFPWAHLLFSEEALVHWRSDFKKDGARKFGEVAGGLNQMTIRNFEKLLASSPFQTKDFELVPIRKLRLVHNALTREFTTALVRCRLSKAA